MCVDVYTGSTCYKWEANPFHTFTTQCLYADVKADSLYSVGVLMTLYNH